MKNYWYIFVIAGVDPFVYKIHPRDLRGISEYSINKANQYARAAPIPNQAQGQVRNPNLPPYSALVVDQLVDIYDPYAANHAVETIGQFPQQEKDRLLHSVTAKLKTQPLGTDPHKIRHLSLGKLSKLKKLMNEASFNEPRSRQT